MADPAVWITGTGPDKQLNFRLPTGGKGDKGDTGAKGADGANVLPTDTAIANAINGAGTATKAALSATYVPQGYDVILLAGQSNMSGVGTGFTAASDPVHPMIFQLKGKAPNKGTIIPAAEPLDMVDNPTGIGPGLQFARRYISEGLNGGRKVLLVPAAQGGTPLTRVATPTWKPSVTGSLYNNAIDQANTAIASLPGSKIVAILWLQGETDGDLNATGAAYQSDFDALITGFRSSITGADNVPFVLAGMVPEYLNYGTRWEIDAVHRATPKRLPYVGFASSPTNSHLGDGNHFNLAGQRKIGKAMIDAYKIIGVGLEAERAAANTLGVTALPANAYSIRRVVDNYYGPAVKIRRSSDNTEKNIGFLNTTGLLDTGDVLAFAGTGDAFVTTWYDQSGEARHISQTTVGAQPKIVAAGALITSGGKPAVTFDGDDILFNTTPALFAAGKATVAHVLKASAPTSQLRSWSETNSAIGSNQYGMMQPDGATLSTAYPVISGQNMSQPPPSIPLFNGAIHQATGVDDGAQMSSWIDGASSQSGTTYTRPTWTMNRFAIGGIVIPGPVYGNPTTFSEFIAWPAVLSTTDRQAVENNQKAFFGIA